MSDQRRDNNHKAPPGDFHEHAPIRTAFWQSNQWKESRLMYDKLKCPGVFFCIFVLLLETPAGVCSLCPQNLETSHPLLISVVTSPSSCGDSVTGLRCPVGQSEVSLEKLMDGSIFTPLVFSLGPLVGSA